MAMMCIFKRIYTVIFIGRGSSSQSPTGVQYIEIGMKTLNLVPRSPFEFSEIRIFSSVSHSQLIQTAPLYPVMLEILPHTLLVS